jgi:Na+/H+ antiporter NhaD/arsenite permease-like protein
MDIKIEMVSFLGYILIWVVAGVGRKEDSKVKFFSELWFLQVLLLSIAMYLIAYSGTLCN